MLWCSIALQGLRLPTRQAGWPFQFHELFFISIGLYVLLGRFFVDAWQRGRTRYALTQDRVIIVSGLFTRSVQSISLRNLSELTLSERSAGVGTILFGPQQTRWYGGGTQAFPGMQASLPPRFDLIDDARAVYELIRKAQGRQPG